MWRERDGVTAKRYPSVNPDIYASLTSSTDLMFFQNTTSRGENVQRRKQLPVVETLPSLGIQVPPRPHSCHRPPGEGVALPTPCEAPMMPPCPERGGRARCGGAGEGGRDPEPPPTRDRRSWVPAGAPPPGSAVSFVERRADRTVGILAAPRTRRLLPSQLNYLHQ